ncbi:MAG: Aminodeoxychorismate synthase component 1 [Phycisphaerae bacterium]|nr:Aminodeoxychorismate synthase component 1 [Phycisphaerae bacterium]
MAATQRDIALDSRLPPGRAGWPAASTLLYCPLMTLPVPTTLPLRIPRVLKQGPAWDDAVAAFAGPDAADAGCVVLDSGRPHRDWARFGYLMHQPRELCVDPADGLPGLAARLRTHGLESSADPLGRFTGGWVGHLGYELGAALEGVPAAGPDAAALPLLRFALYDTVACCDLTDGRWTLFATRLGGDTEADANRRLDALEQRLRERSKDAGTRGHEDAETDADEDAFAVSARLLDAAERSFTRPQYEAAVARVREYIAAGDIYQVNLSQRFSWPLAGDAAAAPGRLFAALRSRHPGWYSALLAWRDEAGGVQAVCSASPELFLKLAGRRVVTRPIKGTIARAPGGAGDQSAIAELLLSAKDAAELAMIVDLERNDLGRVCRFGSVRVTDPRAVETHARVHHTVATVEGELRDGCNVMDLLAATFPGGSITGAPKIRAMQIIAELEPVARSVYTGAVGWIGLDGSALFNIAIRTPLISGGRVYLQVGGGIVTDSQPAGEYDETIAKAQGLVQAAGEVVLNAEC